MDPQHLRKLLPGLTAGFRITSPATAEYNCVAWSAGDSTRWWWPHPHAYWPDPGFQEPSVETLTRAFASFGYETCDNADLEAGVEKVVIYADEAGATHMARQTESGRWTSKLGKLQDIEHDSPAQLEGSEYGRVARVLKRVRAGHR